MKDLIGKRMARHIIDSPIFVVGANRSGTSVLLQALGTHPRVRATTGEAPLMATMATIVDCIEHSEFRDYYVDNLRTPREYLYAHLRKLCFEYVVGPHYGLDGMIQRARRRDISFLKERNWCAKIFPEEEASRGLRGLFGGAKFLYIVRNGIEVVHSRTKFAGFKALDFEAQCRAWASSFRSFDHLARTPDALQVRHEELVADSEGLMRRVLAFLELGYDPRPATLVRSTLLIPLDQPTAAGVDAKAILESRQPAFESWTPEQRAIFKATAGEAMAHAGYEIPF